MAPSREKPLSTPNRSTICSSAHGRCGGGRRSGTRHLHQGTGCGEYIHPRQQCSRVAISNSAQQLHRRKPKLFAHADRRRRCRRPLGRARCQRIRTSARRHRARGVARGNARRSRERPCRTLQVRGRWSCSISRGSARPKSPRFYGCPIGSVKSRLMRARESLRARLAAFRR